MPTTDHSSGVILDRLERARRYHRAYYHANVEKLRLAKRAAFRRRFLINSEKIRSRARELHKQNPFRRREKTIRAAGFTVELYNDFFTCQGGCCAICGGRGSRTLACDHNHKTGVPRGLLCFSCNVGLGLFKDSGVLLDKAKEYLKT